MEEILSREWTLILNLNGDYKITEDSSWFVIGEL